MTSPSVSNLTTVTHTELKALLLLVRDSVVGKTTEAMWIAHCVNELKWGRATAEFVVKKLREQANAMEL